MDNKLSHAQLAIGESSNLAQIALTYSHNFSDQKYKDIVCILACTAQVAIDNAKRVFDIDIVEEIKRIKKELEIPINKYPKFWKLIHSDFNTKNINNNLKCPMNYMSDLNLTNFRSSESTIPIGDFFVKYETTKSEKQKNRKVEEFIQQYAIDFYDMNVVNDGNWHDSSFVNYMLFSFDELIENIKKINFSKNYLGLYSWLLDRAFNMTKRVSVQKNNSNLNKNKSVLLKVLYDINKDNLLKVFKKQ